MNGPSVGKNLRSQTSILLEELRHGRYQLRDVHILDASSNSQKVSAFLPHTRELLSTCANCEVLVEHVSVMSVSNSMVCLSVILSTNRATHVLILVENTGGAGNWSMEFTVTRTRSTRPAWAVFRVRPMVRPRSPVNALRRCRLCSTCVGAIAARAYRTAFPLRTRNAAWRERAARSTKWQVRLYPYTYGSTLSCIETPRIMWDTVCNVQAAWCGATATIWASAGARACAAPPLSLMRHPIAHRLHPRAAAHSPAAHAGRDGGSTLLGRNRSR